MRKEGRESPPEIVRALRCAATPNGDCIGKACPFYVEETVPEEMIAEVGRVKWPGCDVDAINMAAADLIEQMMREDGKENEPLTLEQIFSGAVCIEFKGKMKLETVAFDPDDRTYAGMVRYNQFGIAARNYVDVSSYGSFWRCWEKTPTEEEREEMPWEDET